ncbi:MAG: c-type cytochrome biogenesis protein CcsB [Candidatus Riflebacteria bacterium]|nr:c-type cytochrome biogenesis protein CcsB [Candidatus Riflebacteria bacterium]MBR4570686.1 c-type cytochrome biogenesis protein CcsB [Candidatus Riflebacteria bacterium]
MNESTIFIIAMACYLIAFFLYCVYFSTNKDKIYKIARIANWIGAISAIIALGLRWNEAGYPPLSNMYESMVTLSTFMVLSGIIFTIKHPLAFLEAGSSVFAVMMIGISSLFPSEIKPLIAPLQSNWLYVHVSLAFLGESCFAVAFILSYMYCLRRILGNSAGKTTFENKAEKIACYIVTVGLPIIFIAGMILLALTLKENPKYVNKWQNIVYWLICPAIVTSIVLSIMTYLFRGAIGKGAEKWLPEDSVLDNLTYRAIALGYPLYTVGGLVFGMIWANKAWGRYWGWDPKETWALVTFLVYSVYLHVRLSRGWSGIWTACLAVAGFSVTLFTLFAVNFLISGLHSYI